MQLSPSSISVDPTLLAFTLPGATLPSGTAPTGGFAQLVAALTPGEGSDVAAPTALPAGAPLATLPSQIVFAPQALQSAPCAGSLTNVTAPAELPVDADVAPALISDETSPVDLLTGPSTGKAAANAKVCRAPKRESAKPVVAAGTPAAQSAATAVPLGLEAFVTVPPAPPPVLEVVVEVENQDGERPAASFSDEEDQSGVADDSEEGFTSAQPRASGFASESTAFVAPANAPVETSARPAPAAAVAAPSLASSPELDHAFARASSPSRAAALLASVAGDTPEPTPAASASIFTSSSRSLFASAAGETAAPLTPSAAASDALRAPAATVPLASALDSALRPTLAGMSLPLSSLATADSTPVSELPTPVSLPSTDRNGPTASVAAAEASDAQASAARPPVGELPAHAASGLPENFAAARPRFAGKPARSISESVKSFLNTESKELTSQAETLGTDVAKSPTAMSSRVAPALPPHPSFEYADAVAAPSALAPSAERPAAVAAEQGEAPAAVADAHRAVEVVLHAVDRVAQREQTTVKLEFSVGDADLVVRVELRADQVHATFKTDSAELRDALAHEWQAVAGSHADRGLRLAPAQFSAPTDARDAFSGDAASQQQRHARDFAQPETAPAFARSLTRASTSASASVEAPAVPARPTVPSGTARRLNFFA